MRADILNVELNPCPRSPDVSGPHDLEINASEYSNQMIMVCRLCGVVTKVDLRDDSGS